MSRKKRKQPVTRSPTLPHSESFQRRNTRDAHRIAAPVRRRARVLPYHFSLTEIEDHRRYDHDPNRHLDPLPSPRPARTRQRYHTVFGEAADHRVQLPRALPGYGGMFHVRQVLSDRFSFPRKTVVCVRRKARRSVLFALSRIGRRGKGAKPLRRARWSESSYIRCS